MKKTIIIILLILIFSFYMLAGSYDEKVTRSFSVENSAKFTLKNINGNIDISTYNGKLIKIDALKISEKESELKTVKIIFEYDKDGLNVFPSGYVNNTNTSISYEIKIPENLSEIYLKTVNGNIEGEGYFGDVKSKTVNGKIRFTAEMRNCNLATVNGSIHIYQKKSFTGDISLKSVNGSIKVELENSSSLNIRGATLNGNIKSDFALKITRGFVGSSFSGILNKGEYKLKLKTVNGSISLFRN